LQEYKIDPDKVVVINPGVDFNDYEKHDKAWIRHTTRQEWGIHPAELVMIFVSMNFEIKGLDEILPALAKLKAQNYPFKLVVVGKGNVPKYKSLAQKAQIGQDVIFTGPLNKENLIKMYLAGDLYLMLSKFDTFGMVVLEAMAAGLPVIISNHVGARDIVREGENGFIIDDTSDTESIVARAALFFDEEVRRKMSGAAQQTAAQNTWDTVAEKYRNIYDKILSDQEKSTLDV